MTDAIDNNSFLPKQIKDQVVLFYQELDEKKFRGALLLLRDIGESLVKFYGIILYCDAINHCINSSEEDENYIKLTKVLQKLFLKFPAFGDWLEFYFEVARLVNNDMNKELLVFPELVSFLIKKNSKKVNTKNAKYLKKMVEWRNKTIGHSITSHCDDLILESINLILPEVEYIIEESTFFKRFEFSTSSDISENILLSLDEEYNIVLLKNSDNKITFSLSPLFLSRKKNNIETLLSFDKLQKSYYFIDFYYGTTVKFPKLNLMDDWIDNIEKTSRLKFLSNFLFHLFVAGDGGVRIAGVYGVSR